MDVLHLVLVVLVKVHVIYINKLLVIKHLNHQKNADSLQTVLVQQVYRALNPKSYCLNYKEDSKPWILGK